MILTLINTNPVPTFILLILKGVVVICTTGCYSSPVNHTNKWRISSWRNTRTTCSAKRTAFEVLEQVSRLAPLDKPVLVIGERGTGKELIANRLHLFALAGTVHLPQLRGAE